MCCHALKGATLASAANVYDDNKIINSSKIFVLLNSKFQKILYLILKLIGVLVSVIQSFEKLDAVFLLFKTRKSFS